MGRAFKYVILGGGTAAGYAAREFARRGVEKAELCIISEEQVPPYERPALSKGYLMPDGKVRLPTFHTCVGVGDERQTAKWYKEKGIELLLGTRIVAVHVKRCTLTTAAGETISFKTLLIATGSIPVHLEDFGVTGTEYGRICYLRDVGDAERVVEAMRECRHGRAVVIGGGYIGMEAAAALVENQINTTMVFPEPHCMPRLFTKEMAEWYEEQYKARGVQFVKSSHIIGFEPKDTQTPGTAAKSPPAVGAVVLKDGTQFPADMVVVGVGIRPNTDLFKGQLAVQERGGGLLVDSHLRSITASNVFVIGDAAAVPLPLYGGAARRLEHVDHARKSAAHAVEVIFSSNPLPVYDYLPFFYSRVFNLSWQFFGDNAGKCVLFGDIDTGSSGPTTTGSQTEAAAARKKFGAYFVDKGRVVGAFLEGGTKDEYGAMALVARAQKKVGDTKRLADLGTEFALREARGVPVTAPKSVTTPESVRVKETTVHPLSKGKDSKAGSSGNMAPEVSGLKRLQLTHEDKNENQPPMYMVQASAGVAVAVGITFLAIWHGRYWKRLW